VKRTYANASASPTETRYLWCGDAICQKRDGSDAIQAAYYAEGEQQGNTALYYVKDHLGSVTDVIDAQGKRIGELDYGPYGENIKAAGQVTDYRYAGMFHLPETGLYLTHYRLYDPDTGRWLNRDPIGEMGGLNLYGYVGGNPVNFVDPDGLQSIAACANPANAAACAAAGITTARPIPVPIPLPLPPMESRASEKERATDIPSYANGKIKGPNEDCDDFAKRIVEEQFGCDHPRAKARGGGSDYSMIKKFCERGGKK
jgi:RHS repeat-associated protein